MKSYIAEKFDKENFARYSDVGIYESGAGFYIGTMYNNPEGFMEPGTRESMEYFPSYEVANRAFKTGNWTQRPAP